MAWPEGHKQLSVHCFARRYTTKPIRVSQKGHALQSPSQLGMRPFAQTRCIWQQDHHCRVQRCRSIHCARQRLTGDLWFLSGVKHVMKCFCSIANFNSQFKCCKSHFCTTQCCDHWWHYWDGRGHMKLKEKMGIP